MMKLYTNAMAFLYTFKNDQRGVTAIEYGLIAVAMAVVLGVAFGSTSDGSILGELKKSFATVASKMTDVNTAAASVKS